MSDADLRKIWSWNSHVPSPSTTSVHSLISQRVQKQPNALAVNAWDGDWTYAQLDSASTHLAYLLINEHHVGPKTIVPLLFEKSRWASVAILAVMKAGGASVSLDVNQPENRWLSIVDQANPVVILSSAYMQDQAHRLATDCDAKSKVVDDMYLQVEMLWEDKIHPQSLPAVRPDDWLYLVFTSGSTGEPKGVIVTHGNFSSAIKHQQQAHGFEEGPICRVYDFASYAFDVSWSNILHTLTCGGTLCVPSENERKNDLVASIKRFGTTHLDVTPSVARLLPDSTLKELKTMVLGGESLPADCAERWSNLVNVKNPFGPSECTPTATIANIQPGTSFKGTIGKGLGVNTWVVDPETADSLVPVGNVGELWLEGPLVGAGYLGDVAKTAEAFVENPAWLRRGLVSAGYNGRRGRMYRTGDLVRYDGDDGSLVFIQRKDTQVKINGQRVELGEIEHHVKAILPQAMDVSQVIAEVIVPQDSSHGVLVAFLEMDGRPVEESSALAKEMTSELREQLRAQIPVYMVPSVYIALESFPLTTTGKIDRRRIRALGAELSLAMNVSDSENRSSPRQPTTTVEADFLRLWEAALGMQSNVLTIEDNFLKLGGDSIAAMKLVGAARKMAIDLTVADIFMHPQLQDMVKIARTVADDEEQLVLPLSLLQLTEQNRYRAVEEAAGICQLHVSQIEDILPCTPLQEGLLALTAKRPGDYVVRYCLELEANVDHQRLQMALKEVMEATPILRTRIVNLHGCGLVQVIVSDRELLLLPTEDSANRPNNQDVIGLNSPLVKLRLERRSNKAFFLWTMHHAVFDGWSIRLIMDNLERVYRGEVTRPPPPFQRFVKYTQALDDSQAKAFWAAQFDGLDAEVFPGLPWAGYEPKASDVHRHNIKGLSWSSSKGITPSSVVRSAFSLLISAYSNSSDVVFGATVTGRQAAVSGVEQMTGPTIATLPVRVAVDTSKSLYEFLEQVQNQSIRTTPFEQMGLQRIRRINPNAERACQFQALLVVQPVEEAEDVGYGSVFSHSTRDLELGDAQSSGELDTYALTMECHLTKEGVQLRVAFDSAALSEDQVKRVATNFEHILRQICSANPNQRLSDIQTTSPADIRTIWRWNAIVPEAAEVCVHEIFVKTALRQPAAPAVAAWDGDWSYSQLHALSTRLARHLATLNIAGTVVPLLFEKSKWMPVAALAVFKAGGACLSLDSELPKERLRIMVHQVGPVVVILSSQSKRDLARSLVDETTAVETIDTDRVMALTQFSSTNTTFQRARLPLVKPADRLYVIFTSGSTGQPKCVVITHSNFSSAIRYQQEEHGFRPTSRVYDFASYSFDVSWSNILHTLTCGGCLCVPSDIERKSDLAGSIERFQITHLDLTPSIARILPLSLFQQLDTIVLGGEKLLEEDAQRWAPLVTVKNPYGPCECTPTATLTTITANDKYSFRGSIGKGLGLNTWVVHPSGESLAPISSIGELWLEGPLVGPGYLGDSEKTAAAFVQDPTWLVRGGRGGRMYRTGDLVRYNDDGSLTFIGRRDAQVKIHGQRIELGEIEGQMTRLTATRQAACLFPSSGPAANRLVAVLSVHGSQQDSSVDKNHNAPTAVLAAASGEHVDRHLSALQSLIREALPAYMVPTVWIALEELPLSAAGKLDRRSLQSWLNNIDAQAYTSIVRTEDEEDKGPVSSSSGDEGMIEKVLRETCSHILNVDEANININRSFISNGGDSISAMRLSAEGRTKGLVFSVADLLKGKSLAAFAQTLKAPVAANERTSHVEELFDVDFALSPIQQWFMTQYPNQDDLPSDGYGNQGFYLKLTRRVTPEAMAKAVAVIVDTHSMLRARFERTTTSKGGTWVQRVSRPGDGPHCLSSLHISSFAEIESLAKTRHASLNIREGSIFTADLCILPSEEQYLLFIAHHLVVDLVSWRVILDDLEILINGGSIRPVDISFHHWTQLQASRALEIDMKRVLSTDGIYNNLDFWNFTTETPNTVGDHDHHHLVIDEHTTSSVLSSNINGTLNTEPVDLLISAVWDAFFRIFPDREKLTIFSEGHGRESWSSDIDLSRTVGWFTTISPVSVSRGDMVSKGESIAKTIRFVKDARRRLTANGWEYFTTRYLHPEGREAFQPHSSSPAMEVVFNYHGQFQQFEGGASLFETVDLQGVSEQGPALPAGSLFGVEVSIENGRARYDFSFNRHLNHHNRIVQWAEQIGPSLSAICDELASSAPSKTLCDLEFLKLDYNALDRFHERVVSGVQALYQSGVEDAIPCSPTVDGILLSQVRQPEAYKTLQLYEISSTEPVSANQLSQAWQQVVARQPALRSIFVPGLDSSAAFSQVILQSYHGEMVIVESSNQGNRDAALHALKQLPAVDYQQEFRPPHRVALCQVNKNTVLCQVECSHAITDGASTAIVGQDWVRAYTGTLNSFTTVDLLDTTRAFARSLAARSSDDKMAYWKTKLDGAEPCHFPNISGDGEVGDRSGTVSAIIDGLVFQRIRDFCASHSITVGSVMNSVWALTLSAYTSSRAVCFGYLASGRDLPIAGLDESMGAYANMLVSYVDVDRDLDTAAFARRIHDQTLHDLDHQHCSLASIQHELGLPAGRALFNTIVSFQKTDDRGETNGGVDGGLSFTVLDGEDPTEYDIVLNIGHGAGGIDLVLDYSPSCLSRNNVGRVLSLFQKIASYMASGEALKSMDLASDDDLHDIFSWNHKVPSTANDCVHHLIRDATRRYPENQAVCAWDGEFNYAELDSLSTRLAHRLIDHGVRRGVIVPLCLDKSKWTPVAMMGVMKAGGASVAMDAGQPIERLRTIVGQVQPVVILCSASKTDFANGLAESTVAIEVVDQENLSALLPPLLVRELPDVVPSDTLYIVFTSGSTGVPKGVVVTHANIANAILHQRHILGLTPTSRVYDFSGYMFDVVWCNMYQALSIGGCLCIPGDHDRKSDFIGAIDRLSADVAIFTPSAIRGLEPGALNKLRNLHFIGEPLYVDAFQQIDPQVTITNLYGPSECTTFATAQPVVGREAQAIGIGGGFGLNTWIVEPISGHSLMPIGGIGELWLEGPLVASGYLGDAEKTTSVFVNNPAWLSRGVDNYQGRKGRLYKTGDLVRYDEHGSLQFVGRKDSQVKINGQRVELGEVEVNIRTVLDGAARQVIAEVFTPQQSGNAILVAFIELSAASSDISETELYKLAAVITSRVDESLASRLPAHMIPSFYVPVSSIPVTGTGKTDRKTLRTIGAALTLDQLGVTRLSDGKVKRQPNTAMEKRLQTLWAAVLKMEDPGRISADDSFLRIGGDSIVAMRLVGAARASGLTFSVADVLRHPKLSDLAVEISGVEQSEVTTGQAMTVKGIERFSLLKSGLNVAEAVRVATAALDGIEEDQIEDMYPCTPLQEGMLALTSIRPNEYIAKCALELRSSVDPGRFRQAWSSLVASTPILRTRILDISDEGLVQAVINQKSEKEEKEENQQVMGLGKPLFHVRLSEERDRCVFYLTIHHALYDGWSLGLLFERLEAIYLQKSIPPVPDYKTFVKYATSIDQGSALKFWSHQLQGLNAEIFPSLPSPFYQPKPDKVATYHIDDLRMGTNSDVTLSTIVRAAFALVIADYSDNDDDVVFGVTVTGRQTAVPGIEDMIGPTIATVPIRISIDREEELHAYLTRVQTQSIEMISFEQIGLQNIRGLSSDAKRACSFQTLLIVQPAEEAAEWSSEIIMRDIHEVDENSADNEGMLQQDDTYALTVECHLRKDGSLRLRIGYDSTVLEEKQVQRLAQQFKHILHQICASNNDTLSITQLQTLNSDDARDIWSWNVTLPDTVNVCVHDRISAMAFQLPDKLAVCACDGDWTYHELDSLSTHLAFHLRRLGVNTETIVPLVFEKSKWAPVAMLSVMKAGGASVLVDTAQPEERLRAIIQQVSPSVVLSSTGKHELASRLAAGAAVQTINEAGLRALNRKLGGEWPVLPRVSPSSRLYIVFTSGSTGTPKGVVITHANFSSALTHQREAQGISSSTRLFDFASYAFDVAWANTLTAFECGATLCIPSDADRKDDLNGAIAMFRPTHIDVTPSAALILSAESLRQLDSMTLGGERLTAEWARRWAPHVSLKNSYGPSECTPTATFTQAIPPDGSFAGSIGAGAGVNTWVVDAATGAFLVPIGSSGELWLEGPIVGAGYLDDETKTTGAFIKDPPWLLQGSGVGHLGRQGRLYKTGDLVRYNQDGSLTFVGRADNQVKINGQRVELGEIESHMARHDNTHQTVCLIPSSGPCAKRVVAFFSLRDAKRESTDTTNTIELLTVTAHSKSADRHIQALEALLSETLPSYMIPSIWAPLWDLPMTASGKLDRKTLNTWLISMDAETYRMIANVASGQVAQRVPHTAVESLLVDAVSRVLNIAVADIDLGRSFISNGGDSISAMRLSSQWRAAASAEGFSVAALMRSKSLADFAQALSPAAGTMAARIDMQEEAMESPFGLSPIQQWFFEQLESPKTVTQPDYHYNQGFYVKMTNRTFSEDEVAGAVERLVNHHSMLRARFERIEGSWLQSVSKANEGTYHFASHKASSLNKVASLAMQSHVSINIEHGRVFSADLCAMPSTGEQYLILIAHHLVIDLVSWRILLDDLETLLSGGTLQHSLPFQTWAKLQQAHVSSSPKFLPEKLLSTKDLGNDLDFWGFTPSTPNNNDAHSTCLVEIGRETTSQLLGAANDTYNTEPVDLLLSAVWDAFLSTFSRRQGLTIFSEAHGREPWSAVADTVDLSRTVGWFTTISPISVSRDDTANAANIVRLVKDARRRLPANGWAYFASRYLNPEAKKVFEAHTSTMEVTFNYHGQFQQLESEESFFKDVTLPGVSEQGSAIPASSLFNIEVSLEGGVVQFEVSFNRHINHQSDIQEWISLIAPSLQSICKNLVNTRSRPSRTLCDYEFLTTDYPVLDNFQTGLATQIESLNGSAIEEVYPCTPTVDGILLSQTRQASSYITVALYEISSRDKKPVDIDHLIQSWQKVVAYQPALRSIFIGGLDASAAFNQVVIKTYRGEVVLLPPVEDRAFAAAALSQLPTLDYTQVRPPHRVALVPIQGKVVVKIEMSHAITDGASASILIEDWIQAYIGTLSTVDLLSTTSGYVRALQTGKTKDEKLGYWKKKLADVEPCYFPALARGGFSSSSERSTAATTSASTISIKDALFARIQQFYSAPSSVTPASLLQSAWARTLSAYTSNEGKSVVFGYLCSGRDAPVAGIDLSVGAYANMMVCRAEIETTGRDGFLRGVHEQIMQDMDYQHCSLAEIQHELGAGRGLFNSVVSFQRVEDEQQDATGAGLAFEGLDGLDPTEYDIVLGINYATDHIEVELEYADTHLTDEQAKRVLSLFQKHTAALIADQDNNGDDDDRQQHFISDEDAQQVWQWNASVPTASERCLHDLIADTARQNPSAPAICAHDGNFTYGDMDVLATRLAQRLVQLGVESGKKMIVPLCFEKSIWTPISMLAVMKAGGTCVTLDTAQPEERLRGIVRQVQPDQKQHQVILCSSAFQDLAGRLADDAVLQVVDKGILTLPGVSSPLPVVSPSTNLYIIFTSGSTGVPKGVMISHANYASAVLHQQAAHGFTISSKVYDFASYAFDVSWSNFLHTLTIGACLCIPSDEDRRNDLVGSIQRLGATHVDVTPSVARLLPAEALQKVQTLVLGGEKMPDEARKWAHLVIGSVKNPYGPSECTPTATITDVDPNATFTGSIGRGIGLNTWVVDIDGQSLVPVGCTGELWLEGPLVGNGYLGDEEKTAAAFVTDPAWLLRGADGHPGRRGRLYRTGDLVHYCANGSLVFVGRKDMSQVKINAQRVELGEVEYHVSACIPEGAVKQVVAEVVTPQHNGSAMLVAFLEMDSSSEAGVLIASFSLEEKLSLRVPIHMVPAAYIPLEQIPLTANGKTDRKRLQEMGKFLTPAQLRPVVSSNSGSPVPSRQPTSMEKILRSLWAAVLKMDAEQIETSDSFFRMGGDSIVAMRLVGAARDTGLSLSVADILKNPKLDAMAGVLQFFGRGEADQRSIEEPDMIDVLSYEPFSLLSSGVNTTGLWRRLPEYGIARDAVHDILPVTDQQARLVSQTYTANRSMLLYHTLDGRGTPDISEIRAACHKLVQRFDMLRTVFIAHGSCFVQVVLRDLTLEIPVLATSHRNLEDCVEDIRQYDSARASLRFGSPLAGFAIIHQTRTNKWRLVARMSHAQHDGMSLLKMWSEFEKLYRPMNKKQWNTRPQQLLSPSADAHLTPPSSPDMSASGSSNNGASPAQQFSFSQHMRALEQTNKIAARRYWSTLLQSSSPTVVRPQPSHTLRIGEGPCVVREIPRATLPPCDFTFFTVLKAAWAYVLARAAASDDIVFSTLTHGRGLHGSHDAFGPCVNITPTRIRFGDGWQATDLMSAVQDQHVASLPFEQLGSREIVRECTDWPRWMFAGSVVYHHNFEDGDGQYDDVYTRGMHEEGDAARQGFAVAGDVDNVDVHVTSKPSDDGKAFRIELSFAVGTVSERMAGLLVTKLCETINLFHRVSDMPLPSSIDLRSLAASLPQPVNPNGHDGLLLEPSTEEVMVAQLCPEDIRQALVASWAEALDLGVEMVPAAHEATSFFDLGGDIVCASVLSAHMQRQGYDLGIEDVLENPMICQQLGLLGWRLLRV